MIKKLKQIIKKPIRASIQRVWNKNHPDWLLILTYHRVSDHFDPQIHLPGGWNQTQDFENQIKLLTNKYKVLPLHDALQHLHHGTLSGHCIAITIDDGDSSVKTHIAPILEKYNCPATIFITSAYLDCQYLHFPFIYRYLINHPEPEKRHLITEQHREILLQLRKTNNPAEYNKQRPFLEDLSNQLTGLQHLFLTKAELKSLNPAIFSIGLHGHEHQRHSMMDAHWQSESIRKNIEALSELENYRAIFALPFGSSRDWNVDTIKACLEHDVAFLTCTGGINYTRSIEYRRVFADGCEIDDLISAETSGII